MKPHQSKKHKQKLAVKTVLVSAVILCLTVELWLLLLSTSGPPKPFANIERIPVQRKQRSGQDTTARSNDSQATESASDGVLPQWIIDYAKWHTEMRQRFPGQSLLDDPNAPPVLIRTCLGLCGGLNDRIGQLPWDLYLANQTGRVLLMHWHRPVPLENFLVPAGLDWRVPEKAPGFFPQSPEVRVSRNGMKIVRAIPELFEGYDEAAPTASFWNSHLEKALQRATRGDFRSKKILRHRLLGHLDEVVLEERLRALGETDMIHNTATFGQIFRLFFQPAPEVQTSIERVYAQLNISPQQYGAVHVRVRHPKATPKNVMVKGKNEDYTADKTGLPWHGETKAFAIAVATRAVKCARMHFGSTEKQLPLYFYSDSNDLVRYMIYEGNNPLEFGQMVARKDYDTENAHIDKQKGRDPPAYYNTFVDLLIAANAKCIALGVGNFAVLASKISGTQCKVLYQKESWGGKEKRSKSYKDLQQCDLPEATIS